MADTPIPDDEHGADLPMNMTASVMLTGLPRDAHQALADVEAIDAGKGRRPNLLVMPSKILSHLRPRLCLFKRLLEFWTTILGHFDDTR